MREEDLDAIRAETVSVLIPGGGVWISVLLSECSLQFVEPVEEVLRRMRERLPAGDAVLAVHDRPAGWPHLMLTMGVPS